MCTFRAIIKESTGQPEDVNLLLAALSTMGNMRPYAGSMASTTEAGKPVKGEEISQKDIPSQHKM